MECTLDKKKVSLGKRIGAFLIDHTLFTLICMLIFIPKLVDDPSEFANNFITQLNLMLAFAFLLYTIKDIINGQSIGKRILKISVRKYNAYDEKPSILSLLARNMFIYIWPIEAVILLKHKDNRRLGDIICKTQVINVPFETTTTTKKSNIKRIVLIITTVLIALLMFFTLIFTGLKNSSAYKTSINYIEQNAEINKITGGIKNYGLFPIGNVQVTNGYGESNFSIKVKGKSSSVTVHIYLTKTPNEQWQVEEMTLDK